MVGLQAVVGSVLGARVADPLTGYVEPDNVFLAGAGAAAVGRALGHPMDTLRTRMMVDPARHGSLLAGRAAIIAEGARTYANGCTSLLVDIIPYAFIGGAVYGSTLAALAGAQQPETASPISNASWEVVVSAAVATAVAETVLYPVETMRRRLQAQEIKPMPDLTVDPMEDPDAAKAKQQSPAQKARAAAAAAEDAAQSAAVKDASKEGPRDAVRDAARDAAEAGEKDAVKVVEGAAAEIEGVFAGMRQFGVRAMFRGIVLSWARITPLVAASALTYNLAESFWVGYNESHPEILESDSARLFHRPTSVGTGSLWDGLIPFRW